MDRFPVVRSSASGLQRDRSGGGYVVRGCKLSSSITARSGPAFTARHTGRSEERVGPRWDRWNAHDRPYNRMAYGSKRSAAAGTRSKSAPAYLSRDAREDRGSAWTVSGRAEPPRPGGERGARQTLRGAENLAWRFTADPPVNEQARDMAEAILRHGRPYMDAHAELDRLIEALKKAVPWGVQPGAPAGRVRLAGRPRSRRGRSSTAKSRSSRAARILRPMTSEPSRGDPARNCFTCDLAKPLRCRPPETSRKTSKLSSASRIRARRRCDAMTPPPRP